MEAIFIKYVEMLLRVVIATACGVIIGYERENRNKEAGVRTHAIVAMGAALIMIVSKYGFVDVLKLQNYVLDPSRIAAQIVSGVGFLGVGIIFRDNRSVSGLTTAAGLWATAGVGMAVGSGMYFIGITATILIVCVQFLLHRQTVLKKAHNYNKMVMVLEDSSVLKPLQDKLLSKNIEVEQIEASPTDDLCYRVELLMLYPKGCGSMEVSQIILGYKGVKYLKS
ncbi:MgtC/SapB family protein [Intestinibacillus massiliensis]|nr:MgtC/SapB family protein [Intestinibacillus massiliensis]